jgi:integrase
VCLRHVFKTARRDGYLKALPTEEIPWQRVEKKSRRLHSQTDIEKVCEVGFRESKNGEQLADFLRFLALTGAREQEALRVRWADVDFERRLVTIGAEGQTRTAKPAISSCNQSRSSRQSSP